ncbi:hypothetical protein ACFOWU_03805 [Epilithonimonas zeae]|uniref:Uncharacterized protein n=1 Tax=Epilithonimonas zeae TaxID=1416779 RepID=A0A1N6ERS8_9FLAO|nr:hypothetical protein [Epilithonimonas zeae]SIN85690.1 hypothetical protein SAMN05444409_0807 [Epilithonimonas zeae]
MTILFLILLIPLLAGAWYGIDYLVKKIMKERYNVKITLISFVVAVPVLFMMFVYILLSLAFMSGAEFKD